MRLVGRDEELGVLTGLVDRVREQGAAVVVLGDPGIGKSSLLRAVADYGREAGLMVLHAEGIEAEARMPFAGLHQLLLPVLDGAGRLPAPQRQALAAAFGAGEGTQPEPYLVALAALNLVTDAAARSPLLIVADDVQWLDSPTGDALTFVARRVSGDPVVLVGAVRKGHEPVFTSVGLPAVELRGLDDPSARTMLARHAPGLADAARERILRDAGGNPLALAELPVAIRAGGGRVDPGRGPLPLTARLERAFAVRLADLPGPARDALLVAAADEADDLQEILAAATTLAGRSVGFQALDEAVTAGLVSFDGLHVRFRHPLVRSAILQSETITRRYAAHAALADALAGEPYRRAWHRAQSISGQDDAIADELEDMHLVSLRRGSATEAIWVLERSAQLTTDSAARGRRLLLAAEHAFGLGRADLVDQLLAKAEGTSLSRLDLARMEWLREIFNDGVPGDSGRVLDLCGTAAEAMEAGDSSLALNLLLGAALRCWWADTGPAARARVVEVASHLTDTGGDPRLVATFAVADPVLQGPRVTAILDSVVLEAVSDPAALWLLGMAAHSVGDPVRAADFLSRAETRLRQQGRLGLLSQVLIMQVLDHCELGDWDRALAAVEEGRALARETGQPIWDTGSLSLHCIVLALRGQAAEALAMAAEAERAASGRRLGDLLACVQLARGYALINLGEYAQAYDELRRLFDPADPAFHLTERFHGVMYLAEAAVHAGCAAEASAITARLETDAAITPSPTLHLQLGYARAVLADDEHAEDAFATALRAGLVRWPWVRARTELAYGSWLRRQRRAAAARSPLRSALTTFDIMGAEHWAEQARAELRASGERIEAVQAAVPSTLSAQELQIARLAADGLSNKEIGERLYLSPRTIGSHLYRIFPKLDVSSRTQLAARLGVSGPQPSEDPAG
jgi:DNA-binding CsgD family transcriptional regulator/tetratricopeptide (TPR) repeat protein